MSPLQIVDGAKLRCLEKSVVTMKFVDSLNLSHAYVLLSEIISFRRRINKKKASRITHILGTAEPLTHKRYKNGP